MKKKFALILSLILLTACFSGCERVTVNKPNGVLPDYDAKINELSISIGGWLVPSTLNDEQFEYMKQSGIDTYYFAQCGDDAYYIDVNSITSEDALVLEKMQEYGLDAVLHMGSNRCETIAGIDNASSYPAVKALCYDEPNKKQMDEIKGYLDIVNQNTGDITLFVNMFPSVSYKRCGFFTYKNYLKYFCNQILSNLTVGEKWLSADRYPLTFDKNGNPTLDSNWLFELETVATIAKKYPDVKTNFFIQTVPYGGEVYPAGVVGSHDRVPTYEDVRMQEYTVLCFGFDRFSCFCYGSPCVYWEFNEEQVAMIDRQGNPTQIYYDVSRANNEIKAFDHVLQQFTWHGVFTNDAGKTTKGKGITTNKLFKKLNNRLSIKKINGLKKVYSSQDTLFGYFTDQSQNAGFMVVNCNDTSLKLTDDVTLTFDNAYGYTKALCYVGGQKQIVDIKNDTLTLNLGVGEGVFVIPY